MSESGGLRKHDHPDMTSAVDWALKANYLSIYLTETQKDPACTLVGLSIYSVALATAVALPQVRRPKFPERY